MPRDPELDCPAASEQTPAPTDEIVCPVCGAACDDLGLNAHPHEPFYPELGRLGLLLAEDRGLQNQCQCDEADVSRAFLVCQLPHCLDVVSVLEVSGRPAYFDEDDVGVGFHCEVSQF